MKSLKPVPADGAGPSRKAHKSPICDCSMGSCASKLPIVMLRLVPIVAMFVLAACAVSSKRAVGDELDRLVSAAAAAEPGSIRHTQLSHRVALEAERLALRGQINEVSEGTVDRIIELVSFDDPRAEMSALWGCSALTHFGSRGRRAIPVVEQIASQSAMQQHRTLPPRWENCLAELRRIDPVATSP